MCTVQCTILNFCFLLRAPEEEEPAAAIIEQLAVTVVPGDLTQETTDAVVNPTDEQLSNACEVSQQLIRAGGPVIREKCKEKRRMLLMEYGCLLKEAPILCHH